MASRIVILLTRRRRWWAGRLRIELVRKSLKCFTRGEGRTAEPDHFQSDTAEGGIRDPELAALVAAWSTLPDAIRRAMAALLSSVRGTL